MNGNAFFAIAAVITGASVPAIADDARSWTGFGAGAHTGVGFADYFGQHDSSEPGNVLDFRDVEGPEAVAGFKIHYDHQFENDFVVGGSLDMSFGLGSRTGPRSTEGDVLEAELDYLATAQLRIGYAIDGLLLYGSAGLAFANYDGLITDVQSGITGFAGEGNAGIAVGGGIMWKPWENWSLFTEVLYFIFDDENETSAETPDSDPGDRFGLDGATVFRIGVTYHF